VTDSERKTKVLPRSHIILGMLFWALDHQKSFDKERCMGQLGHIDHDTEEAVRRFLALIADHYDMAGAIIFGSRARGTHRPDSDADVAVLLSGKHQRFLTTKLAMADVAFDVLLETGINISPLPVWLDEWEHPENYSNPALLRNIASEGFRLKNNYGVKP
jgi:predicted nucleotidyltransferase